VAAAAPGLCHESALFAELCARRTPISRDEYLALHPELCDARVVEDLSEAVRQRVRVDIDEALALAEMAALAAANLDSESRGRALRAKGNALWFKGQWRTAVDLFDEAVRLFRDAGQEGEIARTLSTSIQPLMLLGEYDKAMRHAEMARRIFSERGDTLRLARLELNTANIYHRQERFGQALAMYEGAYEQLLPHGDAEAIGVALHNMAVCLISLNAYDRALQIHGRARQVCRDHGMPLLAAQADYNIAYLYYLRGAYDQAIERLQVSRRVYARTGDSYHAALCDLDQSEIYVELNLAQEAAEMANRAWSEFSRLGNGYEAGLSLLNLAMATNQRRAPAKALEYFTLARELFTKEQHPAAESLVDLYRAVVMFQEGRISEAADLSESAMRFFRAAGLLRREAFCHILMGRVRMRQRDVNGAAAECRRARAILAQLDAPPLNYEALLLRGSVYEARGRTRLAYSSYQQARRELETIRGSLQKDDLKIAFVRNRLDAYKRLIQICLRDGTAGASAEEAFGYMESAKSRSLLESLCGRARPAFSEEENAAEERRLRDLRGELNWYYHRIEVEQFRRTGFSPALVQQLQLDASRCEADLLRVLRDFPNARSEQHSVGPSQAMSLDEIRASLKPDSTILEYFQIDETLLGAVVSRDELNIISLGDISPVRNHIRMLQFQTSRLYSPEIFGEKLRAEAIRSSEAHLKSLYDALIRPVRDFLRALHIIVVPHGILHHVPFQALYHDGAPLIASYRISYAASASVYSRCERQPVNPTGTALVLGVPDENTPWIMQEVQAVADALPEPVVRIGNDATYETLRTVGSESHWIHIATHGFFRHDNPLFSRVRLGDSYLSLYDLYNLRLPVDFLALSGCGTGLNVVSEGDELVGLSRGLLYSGARTLLLTQWDVHDRSTAVFMSRFYSRLRQNVDKATAFQHAMLDLRDDYSHPYFWAPFMLFGHAY
jgi:CHAT domain-containing protein